MSDNDQRYPYDDQGHGQRYGHGAGQQGPSSGDQAPYDAYAVPAAPYDAYPAAPEAAAWPTDRPTAPEDAYPQQGQGQTGQGATQTWQGQTWDTRYQPTVQPQQAAYRQNPQAGYEQEAPQHHQAPVYQQPQQAGYEQNPQPAYQQAPQHQAAPYAASGSYPLPPEAPVAPVAPAAPAAADSGYSSPTTVGNGRITDAQRARAEGRSPIIAPGTQPAAITAGLGLLLALGAALGQYALLVPLVLLQAVTAAGWFRLNGMWPARQGIALAFAGGFVADVVLLVAGRGNAPAAILGTLGVWVLLTVVLQLRSHAGADERLYGLTATVASAALAVLAAGHLAAVPDAVTVGGIAVAVAVLVRALPLPGVVSVVLALLASAGAGALAGGFTDFGTQAAFLGLAAGGCALIGLRVASYDYPSRFVHLTAGVALPLTAAAPAVYLIGRAIA
ncbi:hypothetical protein ACFWVP_23680 [Streptomyces sp. NPDC058637]|uniref:hypothetical protein n=1 Tax=Streptomyces sp. NPDC058637 TaxID=3346569 RepID=UPI003655C348